MNSKEKSSITEAANILRVEARQYYDHWRRTDDSTNKTIKEAGIKSYEKYHELNKIARELDIISEGKL